jgi:hypothetical protein
MEPENSLNSLLTTKRIILAWSQLFEAFDSGGSTFLQRDSPSPPPWRLLPESFFQEGFSNYFAP